jgi:predicted nucleic acid-binding protein
MMATVLLDTSVASLLHPKKRNSTARAFYEPYLTGHILALSFQTAAELYLWSEQNRWGKENRDALTELLSQFLIIPYDAHLGQVWAKVMAETRQIGRRLETADAWIAATAIRHALMLLTQDGDLANLKLKGLTVISKQ